MLRRRLLPWRLDLLPHPLLCLVRPADSSMRKSSPVRADATVTRPVVGPAERVRNDLGDTPLPLFALLAAWRLPIDLLLLLKNIEPCRLLLPLYLFLEVHLAISVPLQRLTTRLVLALRACGVGLPLPRTGLAQVLAIICNPPPQGETDNDCSSVFDSLDIDRDDSFRSVLALIWNFHDMEEPAGVASARCKTSLASIYGLMSETSPAFHLPTSPLLRSLLDNTNLALSKFWRTRLCMGSFPSPVEGIVGTTVPPLPLSLDHISFLLGSPLLLLRRQVRSRNGLFLCRPPRFCP